MKVQFILMIIGFLLISGSCTKNTAHPVPSVPFDITINMTLTEYSGLQGVSGWAYVNGGSRGIIVYRRSIDEFIAFDRHSPEDALGDCPQPLTPDQDNFLILEDTCNAATFSLYDGSPITNAQLGLRQYQTLWNGNESLRIYN